MTGYILYKKTRPFPGYIYEFGRVDFDQPEDGSTVAERIRGLLLSDDDLALHTSEDARYLPGDTKETKKIDLVSETLIDQNAEDITPAKQAMINEELKKQAIESNLPTWDQVQAAVESIASLADAKAFLSKLSRVVYWLARGPID